MMIGTWMNLGNKNPDIFGQQNRQTCRKDYRGKAINKLAEENPKLDAAREQRGIYSNPKEIMNSAGEQFSFAVPLQLGSSDPHGVTQHGTTLSVVVKVLGSIKHGSPYS